MFNMALSASHQALHAFQNNIEDIRSLASCKICLRPFYEPFMLSCGHTFCYGCLRNWVCGGESRKKNKSCPECRASIRDQPAPNYALRDLAHIFTDRAELLPVDESLEEHKRGKSEEAQLLADDRRGPGLFKDMFKPFPTWGLMSRPIWDPSDGVQRCPLCNWELEEGFCNHCGFDAVDDSMDEGISDEDEGDDDDDEDDDSLSNGSDISIDIPDVSTGVNEDDEQGTLGPHGTYEATDLSETNTDADPYPWGYRYANATGQNLGETDEDDEDEDDYLDYSDGMGDFIDNGPYGDADSEDGSADDGQDFSLLTERQARRFLDRNPYMDYSDDTQSDGTTNYDGTADEESNVDLNYADGPNGSMSAESSAGEDSSATETPQQSAPKQRGRLIISDDEDDEDDNIEDGEDEANDSDNDEDAVSRQETVADMAPSNASHDIRARDLYGTSHQVSHYGQDADDQNVDDSTDYDDEPDDEVGFQTSTDDEDEPIPAQRFRGRARQLAVHTARRGTSRPSRNQRPSHVGQASGHGYHPYTRPQDTAQSSNRYRDSTSRARGNSRTTTVF